jgi:hypothetical protein
MSFFKGALLAASLGLVAVTSANAALVIDTANGPYEYGGFQEPAAIAKKRFSQPNAAWPNATWPTNGIPQESFNY